MEETINCYSRKNHRPYRKETRHRLPQLGSRTFSITRSRHYRVRNSYLYILKDILELKFYIFTSGDLDESPYMLNHKFSISNLYLTWNWPRVTFNEVKTYFWKPYINSFVIIYILLKPNNDQNFIFFWYFWPLMTLSDLIENSWLLFWPINSVKSIIVKFGLLRCQLPVLSGSESSDRKYQAKSGIFSTFKNQAHRTMVLNNIG